MRLWYQCLAFFELWLFRRARKSIRLYVWLRFIISWLIQFSRKDLCMANFAICFRQQSLESLIKRVYVLWLYQFTHWRSWVIADRSQLLLNILKEPVNHRLLKYEENFYYILTMLNFLTTGTWVEPGDFMRGRLRDDSE